MDIKNLSQEEIASYDNLLKTIVESLDINNTQFDNLVRSYNAVGNYLIEDKELKTYHPVVSPQGSLRLGTFIQPINKDDDLDVDLVYRLTKKDPSWTQFILKNKVGKRLKDSLTYSSMLDEEGRRCWTLKYRDNADSPKERYHMDILPCVVDEEFNARLQRMVNSSYRHDQVDKLSIRITDNKSKGYYTELSSDEWLKSNPDGYALWFASRCKLNPQINSRSLQDIVPIGKRAEKTNLQRIVQLLKRHRDFMFKDEKEDKPISIIITTIAARAYGGEENLLHGLYNVVNKMTVEQRNGVYYVENPVNSEENFADKWPSHPKRQENFLKWLKQVKLDMNSIISSKGIDLQEELSRIFGKEISAAAYSKATEQLKASSASLKVGATGTLGSIGKSLNAANTFYGEE